MNYYNVPDYNLEPPEDTRKRVYSCAICRGAILEGDDYYDIPNLGNCCTECIEDSHHCDAMLDDGSDIAYDIMLDREED